MIARDRLKSREIFLLGGIAVFISAFLLSSSLLHEFTGPVKDKVFSMADGFAYRHFNNFYIYPDSRFYFLFTQNDGLQFHEKGISFDIICSMATNALFNSLFQPVFFCIFTPQVILNYALFPFFLYGVVAYFRKIPIAIIFLFIFYVYIGLRNNVVEPLIRHRMSCELIYLLLGLAGLTGWITRKS